MIENDTVRALGRGTISMNEPMQRLHEEPIKSVLLSSQDQILDNLTQHIPEFTV